MEIFREIPPLKEYIRHQKANGKTIGLVPTMGALHEGHLSLIEPALKENDLTICSIFVNPTQFNNSEDLQKYPRNLDADISLLEKAGCDVLFCPEDGEMYPENNPLSFDFGSLGQVMEGKFRPGHFSGVAVVVSKFFNIVTPNNAYFGQKDLQQFVIISHLASGLNFDINLRCMPIVREKSGLAQSSRNKRLKAPEKKVATVFFKALESAKRLLLSNTDVEATKTEVANIISNTEGVELEYFEIVDKNSLAAISKADDYDKVALCIAGFVGEVRLIDNMFLI